MYLDTCICTIHQVMPRLLIGIGRPSNKADVVDYVLEDFTEEQKASVQGILKDALDTILRHAEKKADDLVQERTKTESSSPQNGSTSANTEDSKADS